MPITRFLTLPVIGLAALGIGQSGPAANPGSAAIAFQAASPQALIRLENGSILYAELAKTIDAKKAKVGDPVSAILLADVLAHGKIVVRHDSKLVGHVTEVQAHTKETPESRLGIVFDKAITKGGDVPSNHCFWPFVRPTVQWWMCLPHLLPRSIPGSRRCRTFRHHRVPTLDTGRLPRRAIR